MYTRVYEIVSAGSSLLVPGIVWYDTRVNLEIFVSANRRVYQVNVRIVYVLKNQKKEKSILVDTIAKNRPLQYDRWRTPVVLGPVKNSSKTKWFSSTATSFARPFIVTKTERERHTGCTSGFMRPPSWLLPAAVAAYDLQPRHRARVTAFFQSTVLNRLPPYHRWPDFFDCFCIRVRHEPHSLHLEHGRHHFQTESRPAVQLS